jgi:beta-aspartyl-peptidase (threonine type)
MQVIVHGGAGGVPDDPAPRQTVLDDAAATGAAADSPLDAVEAAVNVLEADPRFNAGRGGAVQSDGVVRTDAGVMTDDRRVGAAAGMPGVRDAVSVARAVLAETPHVLLAGRGAVDFAEAVGVDTDCGLFTDETRARWTDADAPADADAGAQLAWLRSRFGETTADPSGDATGRDASGSPSTASGLSSRDDDPGEGESTSGESTARDDDVHDHDTVGAVARRGEAFAAATSTGGRWFALAGRVGDVPQVGSGFYCAPAGGASATGAGEDIARVTLARRAVGHLEAGADAPTAADRVIAEFGELTGSSAGVIVCGREGAGSAYNSGGMQTSVATDSG